MRETAEGASPVPYLADQASAEQMAEHMADVLYALEIEPERRFTYISPSVEALVGYTPDEHYRDSSLGMKIIDPHDLPVLLGSMTAPLGVPFEFSVRWIARDGRVVWTHHHCRRVLQSDGRTMVYGAARDVTAQRAMEEELREERDRYQLLSENSRDVVYRRAMDGTILWISPSVTAVLGWAPEDLVGEPASTLIHPEDEEAVDRKRDGIVAAGGKLGEVEFRVRTLDGQWRWMRATGRVLRDASGEPTGGIVQLRDIQAEVDLQVRFSEGLDHDGLTGLASRSLALRRIAETMESHPESRWTLLCAGVNGLTRVNEAFTHTAGDRVLIEVALRLVAAAGHADRVARVAGDEFVVILPEVTDEADAIAAAERLLDAVRGPVAIGAYDIDVTACVGIAVAGIGDAEDLLRDATMAMRQASTRGPDSWRKLDATLASASKGALAVQSDLRDALRGGRVKAWYQPIVSLADGAVCGYEALVRWLQEDGSIVLPDAFLPVVAASRTDLLLALDRAVLSQAFDALQVLPAPLTIAVNVSVATLAHGALCDAVRDEAARTGADPSRLHLEVTETALLNVNESVLSTMAILEGMGVDWWVDDFGTGFSSISHLRDLPIRGLKLDRAFTFGIGEGNERDLRLAEGLVGLAQGMQLLTVAEGVETAEESRILREQGWARAQGWLYGRAAPSPVLAPVT